MHPHPSPTLPGIDRLEQLLDGAGFWTIGPGLEPDRYTVTAFFPQTWTHPDAGRTSRTHTLEVSGDDLTLLVEQLVTALADTVRPAA